MKSLRNKKLWAVGLVLILGMMMACAVIARAQATASISGRTLDNGGASIPDGKVTVKSVETGETRTATTGQDGSYRVLSLPVGKYEVKVEKEGFKASVRSGITLVVGQEAVIDVTLEVGSLTQEVTVTAEAPVVNTTTAETSGLVGEQQVKDLPLNGRSFDNLITLDAGAVSNTTLKSSQINSGMGNRFTISGRRPDANLFLLNGVEYGGNGSLGNTPGGVSGELLGIDAIREFNVIRDSYGAEYGKRSGGQITIVTTSGTNRLHGSVFEFLRNNVLDARNFFDYGYLSGGPRLPHFERNNFGGSLGGPIKKDKTFLFGNFEGFQQLLGLTNVAIVPDANARNGFLPCSAVIPAPSPCTASTPLVNVGLAPGVAPYFQLYPAPNGPEVTTSSGLATGVANSFNSAVQTIREDFGTARFDQIFSNKDTFNGVYTIDDGVSLTPIVTGNPTIELAYRAQVASLSEVHIFSPSFLNTLTFGFSRAYYNFFDIYGPSINVPALAASTPGGFPPVLLIGFNLSGGAIAAVGGGGTQAASSGPASDARNLFTATDTQQITRGAHLLSYGVWFERLQDNDNSGMGSGGYNFSNLQSILQGKPSNFTINPYPTPRGFRSLEGAWFFQDTIRVRSNLTVTAGFRHEFTNGWNEATGRNAAYVLNTLGVLQSQPIIQGSPFVANNAKLLMEPRLGVAWDVFGNGKTAVHAGAGIYHDLLDQLAFFSNKNLPWNQSIAISNGVFPNPQITPQNISTFPGALPFPYFTDPFMKTPALYSYNLGIEQSLGSATALSVGYSGFRSINGIGVMDWNTALPTICGSTAGNCTNLPSLIVGSPATLTTLPNGTYFFPANVPRRNPAMNSAKGTYAGAAGNYNALLVQVTRRISHGLTFKTNYTWSKSFDEASQSYAPTNCASTPLNPSNLKFDYGLSCTDIRHKFGFSGSYNLPIGKGRALWSNPGGVADELISGWQLNVITTVMSGYPFNAQLGFSQSRNGNTSFPDRPSFNPNFTGNLYPHTTKQWFNANAFILPPLGTYGNVPRNYLTSPGLEDVDLSVQKNFPIPLRENMGLLLRVEAFNLLNHANFGVPSILTLNTDGSVRGTAGLITNTSTTSRQLQLALKLTW